MNNQTIQDRIIRIKDMLADCPNATHMPEEIQHILKTALKVVKVTEAAILSNDLQALQQIEGAFLKAETVISSVANASKRKGDTFRSDIQ